MKKFRAGTLAALLVVAACGSKDESSTPEPAATAAPAAPAATTAPVDSGAPADTGAPDDTAAPATEAPAVTGPPEITDSTSGVTDTTIRIGIHAPETIGGIDIGKILGLGDITKLYWSTVNAAGGINGRTVEVVLGDDGYSADVAQQACRDLVDQNVLFISGTSGADQIIACSNLAKEKQIPYMSLGVSEAGLVGEPGYRAMTMTYDQMSALMAEYIVNEIATPETPVAMVRYNSPSSEGAQTAFVDKMTELGGNNVAADAVDKQGNPNELTAECVKLQQANVEVVFMILVPTVSTQFARLCQEQGFTPKFVTISNTLSCSTRPPLGVAELKGCESFAAIRSDPANPLATEANAAWAATYPDREAPDELVTFWGMFDVYREALLETGPDPTTLGFLNALDTMKYDNGLFNPIDFAGTKVASDKIVVNTANDTDPYRTDIISEWTSTFS